MQRKDPCAALSSVSSYDALMMFGGGATIVGEVSMSDDISRLHSFHLSAPTGTADGATSTLSHGCGHARRGVDAALIR